MPGNERRIVRMFPENGRRPDHEIRAKHILDGIQHPWMRRQIERPAKMQMRLREFDGTRFAAETIFEVVAVVESFRGLLRRKD